MTPTLSEVLATVASAMPDPWSTNHVDLYEQDLSQHFDVAEAVAVSSGTAALHCALVALDIAAGDEVLLPAAAPLSSIAPVLYVGATPVFVDSGARGESLDIDDLASKLTDRTRLVVPVHLWGRTGDVVRLVEYARAHGLRVVEDARDAIGTRFDDQLAGTFGDLGCISTNDKQVLWSGQGGFILTQDTTLAERCRAARWHWQTPPREQAPYGELGYNYALAEPLAAIARANLARLDDVLEQRRNQYHALASMLAEAPGLRPIETARLEEWNASSALFRIDLSRPRKFCAHLSAAGVVNCVGSYRMVAADQLGLLGRYVTDPCLRARTAIDTTLAIPLSPHHDESRIRWLGSTIHEAALAWPATEDLEEHR